MLTRAPNGRRTTVQVRGTASEYWDLTGGAKRASRRLRPGCLEKVAGPTGLVGASGTIARIGPSSAVAEQDPATDTSSTRRPAPRGRSRRPRARRAPTTRSRPNPWPPKRAPLARQSRTTSGTPAVTPSGVRRWRGAHVAIAAEATGGTFDKRVPILKSAIWAPGRAGSAEPAVPFPGPSTHALPSTAPSYYCA